MVLLGRLHPMLVHFPIALVIFAAVAEAVATVTDLGPWRTVAVANVRAAAAFGVVAAIAGWRLAAAPGTELTAILQWHRWLGAIATSTTVLAAMASSDAGCRSVGRVWIYRATLFSAATLVAVTGHFGGVLVWGADFLRR